MNALVIGLGVSGQSAAELLMHQGYKVIAVDKNSEQLKTSEPVHSLAMRGLTILSDQISFPETALNLVVLSPGISDQHPLCRQARKQGVEVIGEIELACRALRNPMLGITGTNGKTTVTLLVAHILNELGIAAHAMGNSGVPLSRAPLSISSEEIISLELSSYQLETLNTTCLDAAIILNITPDHLDRYADMRAYVAAKMRIFDRVKPGGERWIHENTAREFPFSGAKIYGNSAKCDLRRSGSQVIYKEKVAFLLPKMYEEGFQHDVENIMAAYALCHRFCATGDQFLHALESFKKPPHRLEYVATIAGVEYYDDSKGTNIDAVVRAVESIKRPIVLIAGGVDKQTGYAPWISTFKDRVKGICVIGEAANNINKELSEHYIVKQYSCLKSAVEGAVEMAEQGDAVLLSPGCASTDMFKDYADRGNQFKAIVKAL